MAHPVPFALATAPNPPEVTLLEQPRRRAARRHGCNRFRPVRVLCGPALAPGWTTLRDVSRQGIGLLGQVPFESGAALTVQMRRGGRLPAITLRAEVRYVRALPGGRWVAGCRLSRPLTEEEVRILL